MEAILPLCARYNLPVVAISNDESGISEDPDIRFEVARKIVERAADHGVPAHDIVVDPLVMPVGAMASAGRQVFTLVRRLRNELGREHHLRRLEHLVRAAAPARHQRSLPADGDRRGHDQRDHEPGARRRDGGDPGRQFPDEPRPERRRPGSGFPGFSTRSPRARPLPRPRSRRAARVAAAGAAAAGGPGNRGRFQSTVPPPDPIAACRADQSCRSPRNAGIGATGLTRFALAQAWRPLGTDEASHVLLKGVRLTWGCVC
jgi:hypothetical protein